jgi:hypothetical protein
MATEVAKLGNLRSRLKSLGRRRCVERWITGWSGLVVAVMLALALAFVVDYSLRLRRIERLASLLMVVGATLWAFRKLTRPYLSGPESLGNLALLVERRQKIDSDLVAALEFDGQLPRSTHAGTGRTQNAGALATAESPQLRAAVVDYVADFATTVNVAEGEDSRLMRRRMAWAVGLVLLAAVLSLAFRAHAAAFLDRMLLGTAHYPSRTRIAEFLVNRQSAFQPLSALPEGAAVKFEVRLEGVLPELVELRLESKSGARSTLLLSKVADTSGVTTTVNGGGTGNWYTAELANLAETLWLELVAGDASVDPVALQVSARPVLLVNLQATPPEYASGLIQSKDEAAAAGMTRQIAVLEGSRVDLEVTCHNQELQSVTLHRGEQTVALVQRTQPSPGWVLPESAAALLAQVTEPLSLEIDARNVDGVGPARRVPVLIRMLTDRVPRVVGAVITERVLPTAKPSIVYGATDDLALGEIRLTWQVRRNDGTVVDGMKMLRQRNGKKEETTWRGKSAFDLKPLGLVAGEEVRVTLEAVDYRGALPGKASAGEPIVFQVTDESGILSGLAEADERSARQLDQIIERQLGLGGSP